jgi:hypothetical protein
MSFSQIKHLARPDAWALDLKLKVDGRPFDLRGSEYIIPVIRDTSPKMVVKKAAQTRFTITFLVRTFNWIVERGWHHLYLLPLKTGAVPFVQSRIDPIIDSNAYVQAKFKSVDNRLHKQTTNDIKLLIRGTNVESELQETPVDVVVFDEYDRMVQDFLEDAKHRTDGSSVKRLTYLSTPSVPGHGVDSDDMWYASDMHKWEIACPGCGRFQFLDFENVKVGKDQHDCVVECSHCSRPFRDVERAALNATGRWSPYNLEGNFRGYQINQFCSPTMLLEGIMESFFLGQTDQRKLKAFYNQSLGEPFSSPGDMVTIELLDQCREEGYHGGGIPNGPLFIGVDVGHDVLHVEADYIDRFDRTRLWQVKRFVDNPRDGNAFDQLDKWLASLNSFVCVIDAHPDKREAAALSKKYPGRVFVGFEMDRPQTEQVAVWSDVKYKEPTKVIIDRTMAFDSVIYQMMNGMYAIPIQAREFGEAMPRREYNGWYHQMTQQVRVEEEDTKGRIVARWKKNKNPDHWHHARMFAFIASLRKPMLNISPNVAAAFKVAGSMVGA